MHFVSASRFLDLSAFFHIIYR